ncbi:MAG: hypothetical protein CL928_10055 [Deltaproteobacteria bacterium]|nr:hypothetical protein [Deltaproteobacteria bacterium]
MDVNLIVAALVTGSFAVSGGVKVLGTTRASAAFKRWGYPPFYRITIGVIELLGALMLHHESTRQPAGALLLVLLVGGLATHIKFKEWHVIAVPLVLGGLLVRLLLSA